MQRRKLRWVLAGLALGLVAFALWPVRPPAPDRITQENFDRIQEGMTCAEVEALLGGPPGDYRSVETESIGRFIGPEDIDPGECARCDPEDPCSRVAWIGNDGIIRVQFSSGVVTLEDWGGLIGRPLGAIPTRPHLSAQFFRTARKERGSLDRLLWRVKRQWRRWFPER
jgi:hypothetical protein